MLYYIWYLLGYSEEEEEITSIKTPEEIREKIKIAEIIPQKHVVLYADVIAELKEKLRTYKNMHNFEND